MKSDEVTVYVVICKEDNEKYIKAWSDDHKLVDAYMEFHKCKSDKVVRYSMNPTEAIDFQNENSYAEIVLGAVNVMIKKGQIKSMAIPLTQTDINFINTDTNTFFADRVRYDTLNMVFPYFKDKYQRGLRQIFLTNIISKVVHNKQDDKIANSINMDELRALIKSRAIDFGM
jgi:hypothetical protein